MPVIILNGVGSAGKTCTAKALQAIASRPYRHVAMDAFPDMLPEAMVDHPDGLVMESVPKNGPPAVALRSGPVLRRAMRGMRHAVAAMAAQGNHLIVDEVLRDADTEREYRALLAGFELHIVGLLAPLDVLERRERARGDRRIGLARWQYERVHRGVTYDLELDAGPTSPLECALRIKARFGL